MEKDNYTEEMEIQHLFSGNKKMLTEKDRRTKVSQEQLSMFPYNCIVWIQFREKFSKIKEHNEGLISSTGFLISRDLVLTSARNFFKVNEETNEVIQLTPFSLKFWESNDEKAKATTSKEILKIQDSKSNFTYFSLLSQIVMLKSMLNKELDNQMKVKLKEKILPLEIDSIKHDFALIKLGETVERQAYFPLCSNLRDKVQATVTGYQQINNLEAQMFTHSNSLDSINDDGLFYDIDTSEQQRGSPVYIFESNQIKAVGIHKAFLPNKGLSYATMINEEMIKVLQVWAHQINSSFQVINEDRSITQEQKPEESNSLSQEQSINQKYFNNRSNYYKKMENQQADRHQEQKKIQRAILFNTRGIQCYQNNNLHQAYQYYNRSLNIYQRVNKVAISWAATLHNMGLVNYKQNKFNQALEYYNKSLSMRQNLNQVQSIDYADTLHNIGIVYRKLKKFNQALEWYQRSLFIKQSVRGNESIDYANTLNSIGRVYDALDNLPQALKYFNKQLEIREKIKGNESIDCINVLECIGLIYNKLSEHERATQFFHRAGRIKAICK